MANQRKAEISQMNVGFELPPGSFKLDSAMVAAYLKAVEEDSALYRDTDLVPPTAIAALAMSALSESIAMPPGTVHISQELEFLGTACREDTITCQSRVTRKQDRGRLHMMTIEMNILKEQQKVMTAKVGFILP